jgi:Mg2+ and Co2+ transporter CorA
MPELAGRNSYFVLIGVVVAVVLVLYRYLKKVRWL